MPIPNYIDSYPTKMFEYIALGLPVIASDFELYKGIIEKNKVGICVSPLNVNEFESALLRLREDQSLLQEMKDNTQGILERNYSWSNELNKLDSFYSGIVAAQLKFPEKLKLIFLNSRPSLFKQGLDYYLIKNAQFDNSLLNCVVSRQYTKIRITKYGKCSSSERDYAEL